MRRLLTQKDYVADAICVSQTAIYAQGVGLGASKGKEVGKYADGYKGYLNMAQDAVWTLLRLSCLCLLMHYSVIGARQIQPMNQHGSSISRGLWSTAFKSESKVPSMEWLCTISLSHYLCGSTHLNPHWRL